MGCINSTKNLCELKFKSNNVGNVFRIRVVRLLNDSSMIRSGFLDLTPQELIFTTFGTDPMVWSLRHLRRYGLNRDIFSFEAGRRCRTGPGIYVFRCQQADSFFQVFQSHVNTTTCENDILFQAFHQAIHPDLNQYNDYLQPISYAANVAPNSSHVEHVVSVNGEQFPSLPIRYNPNEGVYYQNQGPNTLQNCNIYQEYPVKQSELRKINAIPIALDRPPDDSAPNYSRIPFSNSKHIYENIESSTETNGKETVKGADVLERCYENFSRINLPVLLSLPADSNRNKNEVNGMNYIVLDLDYKNTPCESGNTNFENVGTSFLIPNLFVGKSDLSEKRSCFLNEKDVFLQSSDKVISPTDTLRYSTIDFIKTCALIKSSNNGSDFDHEESRITRHSKCVRKIYSISE